MAKLGINTGSTPNDGTGDTLLAAALKINQNFTEIYTTLGDGSNLSGVVTSLVGYATEGYVDNAIVGIVTSGALSGYATEGYVDNAILGIGTGIGGGGESYWTSTAAGIHTLSNVGIGTNNPKGRFQVGYASTNTNEFIITSSGDVGIGTTNPEHFDGFGVLTLDGKDYQYLGDTLSGGGNIIFKSKGIKTLDIYAYTDNISGISTATNIDLHYGLYVQQPSGSNIVSLTKSGNVGIGTTNPTSAFTVVGSGTSTSQLYVSGVSTFQNDIKVAEYSYGTNSNQIILGNNKFRIYADGSNTYLKNYDTNSAGDLYIEADEVVIRKYNGTETIAQFTEGAGVKLNYQGINKFETLGAGVTVTGTTFTNQLSVSGVSTFNDNVSVGGTISVNGGVKLATNNATIVGTSGTTGEIKRIGGAPFFYDGSAWREFVLSSGTPVSVPADTEWDDVILRSTFDTNFDDVRFNVSPTVSSGSTITQSSVKIGTGSLRLQNGYLTYPHRSEYNFTGEWTIEGWFYIDTLPVGNSASSDVIFSKGNSGTSGNNFALGLEFAGISNLYNFYWKNNASTTHNGARGTVIAQYSGTNLIQQWIHIALVREPSNGSIHFYLNGIEHGSTASNAVIDNDISNTPTNDMYLGYYQDFTDGRNFDGYVDDFRISTVARYTSVGITTTTTFTPPTTALPTTGTLSSYVQPPGDKYGEIGLGTSPTWRGTSGVTVSRQASGNYRVSFASSYTNRNDYYVLSQGMDQGFASYVGIARSTTHVDFTINRQSNDAAVDIGSLSVQIKNHI